MCTFAKTKQDKTMKKALFTLALLTATVAWAQDDDMYFVPSKKKAKTEVRREVRQDVEYMVRPTVTANTATVTRDVDEYNRRGLSSQQYEYQMSGDTLCIETTPQTRQSLSDYQDAYTEGYYDGMDDMALSRRITRYRRPGLIWYDDLYWDTWYDPFFHTSLYYNRWYYDVWGWNYGWSWHYPYWRWHNPYWGWNTPHYGGGAWHPGHYPGGKPGKPAGSGIAIRNGHVRPSTGRIGATASRNGRTSIERSSGRDYNNNRSTASSSRTQRGKSTSQGNASTSSRPQRSSVSTQNNSTTTHSTPSRSSSGSYGGGSVSRSTGGGGGGSRGGGSRGGGGRGGR